MPETSLYRALSRHPPPMHRASAAHSSSSRLRIRPRICACVCAYVYACVRPCVYARMGMHIGVGASSCARVQTREGPAGTASHDPPCSWFCLAAVGRAGRGSDPVIGRRVLPCVAQDYDDSTSDPTNSAADRLHQRTQAAVRARVGGPRSSVRTARPDKLIARHCARHGGGLPNRLQAQKTRLVSSIAA